MTRSIRIVGWIKARNTRNECPIWAWDFPNANLNRLFSRLDLDHGLLFRLVGFFPGNAGIGVCFGVVAGAEITGVAVVNHLQIVAKLEDLVGVAAPGTTLVLFYVAAGCFLKPVPRSSVGRRHWDYPCRAKGDIQT